MKTCCPGCQTTFRVTPEQLKARAGKVRCGKCQAVFNALDSLLEEAAPATITQSVKTLPAVTTPLRPATPTPPITQVDILLDNEADLETTQPAVTEPPAAVPGLSEAAAQDLAKSSGLIVPRDTREIPGYSKWAEDVMSSPELSSPGKNANTPFLFVALLLMLAFAAQLTFRFRSEIAIAFPVLQPALQAMSEALGTGIPLPRRAELISIETSDLQADPTRGNLLILQATLRNRAAYAQAYPLLELSLTDTLDSAIARRVFQPTEYLLPQNPPEQAFPANADITVRLWIEAREISAAGYRLYVFYP